MFLFSFLGSGPDRGQIPVEWEDFLSVRLFVRSFVLPLKGPTASQAGLRPSQAGLRARQSGLRASQPANRQTNQLTKGRIDAVVYILKKSSQRPKRTPSLVSECMDKVCSHKPKGADSAHIYTQNDAHANAHANAHAHAHAHALAHAHIIHNTCTGPNKVY